MKVTACESVSVGISVEKVCFPVQTERKRKFSCDSEPKTPRKVHTVACGRVCHKEDCFVTE